MPDPHATLLERAGEPRLHRALCLRNVRRGLEARELHQQLDHLVAPALEVFDQGRGTLVERGLEPSDLGVLLVALYLVGTTLDYVDTLMESGFKIQNPNAKESCGCGQSFSA